MAFIETKFDKTAQLEALFTSSAREAVKKACFDTEAEAKVNLTSMGAVDTGALRASIYSNVEGKNSYSKAASEASSKRPDAKILDSIDINQDANRAEGIVAVGVEYGAYVEYGTKKMAARPFFTRAFEKVSESFIKTIERLMSKGI